MQLGNGRWSSQYTGQSRARAVGDSAVDGAGHGAESSGQRPSNACSAKQARNETSELGALAIGAKK